MNWQVRIAAPFVVLMFWPVVVGAAEGGAAPSTKPSVRVAAIGGINDGGFWKAAADRFEQKTGVHVETVVTGNKDAIADVFKKGGIDLVSVQLPQTVLGLVADGYATDARPWVQTELIIVGPADDPAGIKGMTDASAAIKKIIDSKSAFLIHGSLGADQVVRQIVEAGKWQLDDAHTTITLDDHQKRVLQLANDKHAYTLIAAEPFRSGKIPAGNLVELCAGDAVLRRPVLLAAANPDKVAGAHRFEAMRLAEFLCSEPTQEWIAGWRDGEARQRQAFFPVAGVRLVQLPAGVMLRVTGDIDQRLDVTSEIWNSFPQATAKVVGKDGVESVYTGVLLRDILKAAHVPPEGRITHGPWVNATVHIYAADGYSASFALSDFDSNITQQTVILADKMNGEPIPANAGPLKLIAPADKRPARSVRMVLGIDVR